ncbi:hypothetical protein PJI21_29235, partial [Mycobacterium kansasii]
DVTVVEAAVPPEQGLSTMSPGKQNKASSGGEQVDQLGLVESVSLEHNETRSDPSDPAAEP